MNMKLREYVSKYLYAGLAAAIMVIALVILPMFDPNGKLGLQFPETVFGWIAYLVIRICVGIAVFCIFVLGDKQGFTNIEETDEFKIAYEKLYSFKDKHYRPLSPTKYKARTYGIKAVTLSITTIGLAFVFMECVLQYNYTLLLTYVVSLLFGAISALCQMKKAEVYWTKEFPKWVDYYIEQCKQEQQQEELQIKLKQIEQEIEDER